MYRKLLATTALSLVITGGAYAQDAMTPTEDMPLDPAMTAPADGAAMTEAPAAEIVTPAETGINSDGWLASEVMGSTIYNSAGDDAEAIGDVNDFVLDQEGGVAAVVVGVGGFLGIGQKNVAINWDDLELTTDQDGNQRLVSSMTREQLEAAAEFDRAAWLQSEQDNAALVDNGAAPMEPVVVPEGGAMAPAAPPMTDAAPMDAEPAEELPAGGAMTDAAPMDEPEELPAGGAMTDSAPAMTPADDATTDELPAGGAMTDAAPMGAPADDVGAANDPIQETGMTQDVDMVLVEDVSAEELTGTAVYGATDEQIGSIGDIILTQDGAVEAVIIDFGGFLGIGTKPVAISYQNLEFYSDDGDNLVLRTALTAEDLEAAPEYDEDTYANAPNEQLVTLD